jgi:small subunit ribosomal protein S6
VRTYETVFITLPTLTEDEERAIVGGFEQVLSDSGATMFTTDRMGRRRLAYPIQKFEDGVYTRFLYDSGADVPRELERRMRISDKVLRHLTVQLEREWAVGAKEQVIKDAQAKVEAEARRAALEAEGRLAEAEAATGAARERELDADPEIDAEADALIEDVDLEERG